MENVIPLAVSSGNTGRGFRFFCLSDGGQVKGSVRMDLLGTFLDNYRCKCTHNYLTTWFTTYNGQVTR